MNSVPAQGSGWHQGECRHTLPLHKTYKKLSQNFAHKKSSAMHLTIRSAPKSWLGSADWSLGCSFWSLYLSPGDSLLSLPLCSATGPLSSPPCVLLTNQTGCQLRVSQGFGNSESCVEQTCSWRVFWIPKWKEKKKAVCFETSVTLSWWINPYNVLSLLSPKRCTKLAHFWRLYAITVYSQSSRRLHPACMLAKPAADCPSSGPINVLARQMNGEIYRPHEFPLWFSFWFYCWLH